MKIEHNVARIWVDNIDYQSNIVTLAELAHCGGKSDERSEDDNPS